MKKVIHKYRELFSHRAYLDAIAVALVIFIGSLFINFFAAVYATEKISNSVTDIFLDNVRVFDVDLLFIYGPVLMWIFVGLLILSDPKKIPFTLKSIALFVLVRSLFITLTHIGPFPDHLAVDYSLDIVKLFTTGGDLFFSAHTGLPFLMALVFWRQRGLRIFFIIAAVFFGIIVLLAHLHYSIDVLSAFFITYAIAHLADYCFPYDRGLFNSNN